MNINEILVRINAAALNYRDLYLIKNGWAANSSAPFAASSAGAGVVEEIGKDVTRWKKGDRVTTHFFELAKAPTEQAPFVARYVTVPEKAAAAVPASLTDEEAASLSISGLAAWIALAQKAKVQPDDVVLLQGTGGVSLQALQLAKAFGATVIVLTGSPNKITKLASLGADFIINYNENPEWHQRVKEITHGAGADVVLDVVGSATLCQSIYAVKDGGIVAIIGHLSGSEVTIHLMDLIMKGIRLQGIVYSGDMLYSGVNELYDFITTHHIRPVIDILFGSDEVKEALNYLEKGDAFGKIVMKL
jgi:NADPH:quinone reductase-like Zn-dependent oxidoreductase